MQFTPRDKDENGNHTNQLLLSLLLVRAKGEYCFRFLISVCFIIVSHLAFKTCFLKVARYIDSLFAYNNKGKSPL